MKDTHILQLEAQACELAKQGHFSKSKEQGDKVLAMADAWVTQAAGLTQNIVSYSLFGREPCYCETAILNAQHMSTVYPGWQMWVFHDDSVPAHVLTRLTECGVKLQHARTWGIAHWPGTFWRFAAVVAPHAQTVIFRDADSVIHAREQALVATWLASAKPFHVIRDWYSHVELILAGLWGAHAPLLSGMRDWIEHYIATEVLHPTHADQAFLAQCVWPRIRDFTLVHDSVHEGPNITPFEPAPLTPQGEHALGGFKMKKYTFKTTRSGDYQLTIVDSNNQTICTYSRTMVNDQDEFELPAEYHDHLEAKRWRFVLQFVDEAAQ